MEKLNIQGEPVALPDRDAMRRAFTACKYHAPHIFEAGWNACLDEIAKLGPLYTHADPSEVRVTHQALESLKGEANDLRVQLAERDALLQQAVDNEESFNFDHSLISRIKHLLSASAEPSAPVEIDHDALVAAVCVLRSQGLGNLSAAVEEARAALERKPS